MKNYDIIIAGAGFAGLACALEAAGEGLSVLVLERKKDLRHSIHTTGIYVQEAAAEWMPPSEFIKPIAGIRLYAPSLNYIDLVRPGYEFYATDTPNLMQYLAKVAEAAGAEILLDTPFTELSESGDKIIVNNQYSCSFLVGADGARSRLAEAARLDRNSKFLLGVEIEYDVAFNMEERLHCFIDNKLAPGYIAWALPGTKVIQVGTACTDPFKPDIDAVVKRLSTIFDFKNSTIVGRRGGLIPVGGTLNKVARNNIILVGDAAGMVSPLTAGGIYTGIHHGKALGRAIYDYLKVGRAHPASFIPQSYPRFRIKSLLRRAADIVPPDWAINLALSTPPFRRFAEQVFFYKGLKR